MKRLLPLIALALVCAGPAMAGDARCLVDNLPADKRAQVEAAYARSVDEGLASSVYSEEDFEAMLTACKVSMTDDAQLTAAAKALAGYEAETGVALWLKANRDIDDRTLQGVWRATRLADPAVVDRAATDENLTANLVLELAAKLGLEAQEDLSNLAAYVSGRLMRQDSERRF
ncbi:MAG: hypothetical protein EON95_05455 [Caulobacteraceae bacterium]|nr:MAG: hypothetical protein EON95_05455 [Caulobacteraceae bacterium]